jgi:hypothetical protein
MRIGYVVVWTGRDEQLTRMRFIVLKSLAKTMKEKRESALESARDIWMASLPRTPFRERSHLREVVSIRKFLEKKIGQGSGGLSDREPWVTPTLEKGNLATQSA